MNKEEVRIGLNNIHFAKCEGMKIGDMLYFALDAPRGYKFVFRRFAHIVRAIFMKNITFKMKGKTNTLFLFSNWNRGRKDHIIAFENVVNLANNYLEMCPSKYKIRINSFSSIKLLFKWNFQIKKIIKNVSLRLYLIALLYDGYVDYCFFINFCKQNDIFINTLVSYHDAEPLSNFFTQKFNLEKKKTVTLQHGTYDTPESWSVRGIKSDYFLAESKFIADLCKKSNYVGTVIIVGSPHHIGLEINKELDFAKLDRIGLFLDGDGSGNRLVKRNVEMLQIIQKYCKKNHIEMFLKYHPSNKEVFYKRYIDKKVTTICPKKMLANEVGNIVDLTIMSKSTVFITMLKLGKPILIYKNKEDLDAYIYKDEISFSDTDTFEKQVQLVSTQEYKMKIKKCREYYSVSGCIAENYKKAFKKIGIIN